MVAQRLDEDVILHGVIYWVNNIQKETLLRYSNALGTEPLSWYLLLDLPCGIHEHLSGSKFAILSIVGILPTLRAFPEATSRTKGNSYLWQSRSLPFIAAQRFR
jgi:hypothetical protein